MQFRPAAPGPAETSGWGQTTPGPGHAGGSARSLGTWLRDRRSRPSISRSPLPARSLLGRNRQALLFIVCLLFTAVLERALGSVLRGGGNMGRWAQPEFPSRERVRGILNGTPDAESSDRPSSDYSPLAPPLLPPAHLQICIKKAKKTLAGPQLRLTLLPRVGAHLELRAGFQRGAQRRTSPAQSPARPASRR